MKLQPRKIAAKAEKRRRHAKAVQIVRTATEKALRSQGSPAGSAAAAVLARAKEVEMP